MEWLIALMGFITLIALSGIFVGNLDGRRKHKLAMKQEDRLLIEARTKELEEQNRRAELEYRQAQQELERFDRRADGAARLPSVQPVPPEQPGVPG